MLVTLYKNATTSNLRVCACNEAGVSSRVNIKPGETFTADSTGTKTMQLLALGSIVATTEQAHQVPYNPLAPRNPMFPQAPLVPGVPPIPGIRHDGQACTFQGVNNPGPGPVAIALAGALVGQRVTFDKTVAGSDQLATERFETSISAVSHIQQNFVGDLSREKYSLLLN